MPNLTPSESLMQAVLECELPSDCRVLVAVSGGPDSTALLATVVQLAKASFPGWQVRAGHVNHGLRGEESDADESFVRSLCNHLGVKLDVVVVETQQHAGTHHQSVETAARELRYVALENMLANWEGDVLLTSHTAGDQAETLVMRLLRGAGSTGLRGIRVRTGRVVRPFLAIRRETVLAALQEWSLGYRLDSSNLDQRHFRNSVRARLIPALQQVAPHAVDALARSALLLQTEGTYLDEEASEALSMLVIKSEVGSVTADARLLSCFHPSLQRSVLRELLRLVAKDSTKVDARAILGALDLVKKGAFRETRHTSLPGVVAIVSEGRLRLQRTEPTEPPGCGGIKLPVPGQVESPAGKLRASAPIAIAELDLARLLAVCGPYHALCDADALGDALHVRSRLPGDRIRPLGLHGSRKLQDILVDSHIPTQRRDSIAVVHNDTHLVWIPGLVLDERVAITDATSWVVHLNFQPEGGPHRGRIPRFL